jgi:hypothetical protein
VSKADYKQYCSGYIRRDFLFADIYLGSFTQKEGAQSIVRVRSGAAVEGGHTAVEGEPSPWLSISGWK